MVSPVCGAYTDNIVTTTLPVVTLIIVKRSEVGLTSNIFSIHFSANKTPTPPVPSLLPIQKRLYLDSLPSIILADTPLDLHSCI